MEPTVPGSPGIAPHGGEGERGPAFGEGGVPAGRGFCVWLTGLPSSGKTTVGSALRERLEGAGRPVELIDGDELRGSVTSLLRYDATSREVNVRVAAFVASRLARRGVISVVSVIAPYRESREAVRSWFPRFLEVYLSTPLAACETRDVKGLYHRARRGEIELMTGIDDRYDIPERPDLVLDTERATVEECVSRILLSLVERGWLGPVGLTGAARAAAGPRSGSSR